MPSQHDWEEMNGDRFEQMYGHNRSRFYSAGQRPQQERPHVSAPPPATYLLRPIATPGVDLAKQHAALKFLRSEMGEAALGEFYFHGDRINIWERGFTSEPPLLAGQVCALRQRGYHQPAGSLERIVMVKVEKLDCWIDAAYFGAKPPTIFRLS